MGNSPLSGEFPAQMPVTRKMFPFDDVIMSSTMQRGYVISDTNHTVDLSLRTHLPRICNITKNNLGSPLGVVKQPLGPVSLRLMTSHFKDAVTYTQKHKQLNAYFAVYGLKILCEISNVPFEISHKILKPYDVKYAFYEVLKIWRLMRRAPEFQQPTIMGRRISMTSCWRHCVPNLWPLDCLVNGLFTLTTKRTFNARIADPFITMTS